MKHVDNVPDVPVKTQPGNTDLLRSTAAHLIDLPARRFCKLQDRPGVVGKAAGLAVYHLCSFTHAEAAVFCSGCAEEA